MERLCAAKKQLRSLDLQSAEVATHLAAKQRAAEAAAGAEFHDLEEAAQQAQDVLTEAQANLAVSFLTIYRSSWILFSLTLPRLGGYLGPRWRWAILKACWRPGGAGSRGGRPSSGCGDGVASAGNAGGAPIKGIGEWGEEACSNGGEMWEGGAGGGTEATPACGADSEGERTAGGYPKGG